MSSFHTNALQLQPFTTAVARLEALVEGTPFGVVFLEEDGSVLWSCGHAGTVVAEEVCDLEAVTTDASLHEVVSDDERCCYRLVGVALERGFWPAVRMIVAEDVTEALFAGSDPLEEIDVVGIRVEPFTPARVLEVGDLVSDVLEALWHPLALLRGEHPAVAYANRAARALYGLSLGESLRYDAMGLFGHGDGILGRSRDGARIPARFWTIRDTDEVLVLLDPELCDLSVHEVVLGPDLSRPALES